MRTYLLLVVVLTSGLVPRASLLAAPYRLRFRDSTTGLAVSPAALLLDGEEQVALPDANGITTLDVAAGEHRLVVRAHGYHDLVARQQVQDAENVLNTLLLDPVSPSVRTRPADPDSTVVCGYVGDAETGQPLPDAAVALGSVVATTDERGFFQVTVALSDVLVAATPSPGGRSALGELSVSRAGYGTHAIRSILLTGGDSLLVNLQLAPGGVAQVVDEADRRGNLLATLIDGRKPRQDGEATIASAAQATADSVTLAQTAPPSIRVGRSCSCTSCSSVLTMSMETYVKHVLPAEWYASWRADSLKAGAIAIRSYGGYYVYHPISGSYDICDNACCQVYGTGTYSSSDAAVDATAGIYLVDGAGNIARSEYSAENNDLGNRDGCGDCYTQNKPGDGICLSDPVCCGQTQNGHGRGMCQWGSQRWALNQGKTYDWIVDHYYAAFGWTRQNLSIPPPTITQQPAPQAVCAGATASFTIVATGTAPLSYQWRKDGGILTNGGHYAGATSTTLTVSSVSNGEAGDYTCTVTNTGGSATSDAAALSLRGPTSITRQPQPQSGCPGQTFSFTVGAIGSGSISYQWQKDGDDLAEGAHYSGVTSATLTISSAAGADAAAYRCVITADCGSVTSDAADLSLAGPAFAPADFDHDDDVDLADFGHLQSCFTGTGVPNADPACVDAMLEPGDLDVDTGDFEIFRACMSGPDIPADPCCAAR